MGIKINQLPDLVSVAGTDMFPADDSGGTTGKHTLAKVAEFAVNAFETTLGGISRTVKTAIDAIQTLLGSTSISGIGDGTVTGAISSLNSDLTNRTGYTYQSVPKASTFGAGTFNCNVFQYYKQAVVYLNVGLPSIAASTEALMCTLPEGSRPSQKLNMVAVTQSGTPIGLLLQWYADGRITVFPLSAVNGQFMRGTFVIPTA